MPRWAGLFFTVFHLGWGKDYAQRSLFSHHFCGPPLCSKTGLSLWQPAVLPARSCSEVINSDWEPCVHNIMVCCHKADFDILHYDWTFNWIGAADRLWSREQRAGRISKYGNGGSQPAGMRGEACFLWISWSLGRWGHQYGMRRRERKEDLREGERRRCETPFHS